ncbi:MAG TPA: FAD-binding oxidoreductase [Pyrinomonadaceae bacterium]|jgi:D-lactate dehydrogenase (cytochrome)|nr:FAD-binding oxidoreductase [Pyrinomonadaceae bacterium]
MQTKTNPEDVQPYLTDASFIREGHAERVVFPESIDEVSEVLATANRDRTPVTVSGAGTGTVGGRVAFGGIVLATDKLNRIKSIVHQGDGGSALVEPAVILSELQRAVDQEGLLYPPDPTERGCYVGGNVATNASGARTFKYGPTRNYVSRLKVVLASGEVLDLRRGAVHADTQGSMRLGKLKLKLPSYRLPETRKNATGYFVAPRMDAIDLFIGSEGTLGVIGEIEVRLIPKPQGLLSGVVFFADEADVLALVADARQRADARALEFFDNESLNFLREKYPTIPANAVGAIFFEQETNETNEESVLGQWQQLLDQHHAFPDSWFATNEQDQAKLREFRHQLPVLMNEWFAHYKQRKVSTDMAVSDEAFPGLFRLYKDTLRSSGLRYTIFGHIGDNHVHVNILPRDDEEGARAREMYVQFLKYAASVGGTLSAEHGIGKLKREYLRFFYTDDQLREMAAVKKALDPNGILGRGNIFSEDLFAQIS